MVAIRTDSNVEVELSTYSVIVTRDDTKSVQAYLYDHSKIDGNAPWNKSANTQIYLLKTTVFFTVDEDQQRQARSTGAHILDDKRQECERLAVYQCERLRSGLHATIAAVGDWHQACEVASEYL